MYECPNETFIVVVVLFHPCFPELSLTKLIKTGCRIASGKCVKITLSIYPPQNSSNYQTHQNISLLVHIPQKFSQRQHLLQS